MVNVLVVSATPRAHGNSDVLADCAADGARHLERTAGAMVEKVRLAGLRIDPCDACEGCQGSRDAACILDDDMIELYPKILNADSLLLASPIYFFSVCAQMKAFLDRLYALGGAGDWTALRGKRLGVVLTYGDENPLHSGVANAYHMFADAARFLGMEFVDCIAVCCGDAGAVCSDATALASARELGRRLAEPSPKPG